MDIIVPFTKEILFKNKIAEVCSISLEEDVSINDHELLGDFILKGDYKNLDINVDTTPFHHVIPFSINLDDNVDRNTLSYEIADFSYDVINDDTLKVDISFHVSANILKEEESKVIDRDDTFDSDYIEEFISENLNENDTNIEEEIIANDNREEKIDDSAVNIISNNNLKDDFITYHVHIVKIDESIESISQKYNIDKDLILELNDVSTLNLGDKLLIPLINNDN